MDPITQQVVLATAGAAGAGEATYVDDVFSAFLYEGNGSARTIANGIDLSGEGGMVWIKNRDDDSQHHVYDTERGVGKRLRANATNPEDNYASSNPTSSLTAFNSNGFSVGDFNGINGSNDGMVSWTFRKAPGFFDVVTYTGNGTAGRTVSHSLGSTPGMIIIKSTSNSENWQVWHRSVTGNLELDNTGAADSSSVRVTAVSSTNFTLSTFNTSNANGQTYVAYVFAHDDQSFGTSGNESIINCGSFTTDSSGNWSEVNLGFEPQWLLVKRSDSSTAGSWVISDNMRGLGVSKSQYLLADSNSAEGSFTEGWVHLTSTGFKRNTNTNQQASATYIYIAIRRPHKPPAAATEVFEPVSRTSQDPNLFSTALNHVDAVWSKLSSTTTNWLATNRLTEPKYMHLNSTVQESTGSLIHYDYNYKIDASSMGAGYSQINYVFKRAPGFFDVVTYTGTGSLPGVTHNLGVTPELKIIKCRSNSTDWFVGGSALAGLNYGFMRVNTDGAAGSSPSYWAAGSDSATTFSVRNNNTQLDFSGRTYIAYLFATLSGVSKVGSYTGTGSNVNVDCGFTAGARFILIKRTDSTGDWYVWDTARGIVSGNDPYLLINSNAVEVTNTDYVDPLNAGFTVTSSAPAALNTSGGTYLFLAIA